MKELWKFRIYGKVQGVFFRASTKEQAMDLGIFGLVRNEPDGSVYVEAESATENLMVLKKWLEKGPPFSRVEKLEVMEEKETVGYKDFSIEY